MDSSSIVAFHLAEAGRNQVVAGLIDEASTVAIALMSYAEVRAAFAQARRNPRRKPRLSKAAYDTAVADFERDWPSYVRIAIHDRLVHEAGDLAERLAMKGYDAIHLASALELRRQTSESLLFSTWDRRLARAESSEGLDAAHEVA